MGRCGQLTRDRCPISILTLVWMSSQLTEPTECPYLPNRHSKALRWSAVRRWLLTLVFSRAYLDIEI
jgi:hypothetical protein